MKKLKWIVIGLVAVVVAVGVAGYVVLSNMDFEDLRETIQAEASAATGRDLVLAGPIDLKISLKPAVAIDQVSFANAEWGSRPEMVSLERFELEVALMPLFSGNIEIKRLVLIGPDILLETDAEGRGNWELPALAGETGEPAEAGEGGMDMIPSFDQVIIRDGRLTYRDGQSGQEIKLVLNEVTASSKGPSDPLDIEVDGVYNGEAIKLKGTLGAFTQLTDGPFPLKLAAEAAGAKITLDGAIAEPMTGRGADLRVMARGDSLEKLGGLAGTEIPPIGSFDVSARVQWDGEALALSELNVVASDIGVTASGAIGDAIALRGIDLKVTAKGDDLASLGGLADVELPPIGSFDVSARVQGDLEALALSELNVVASDIGVTASGAIADAVALRGIDLKVTAKGDDLASLGGLADVELPPLGPYDVSTGVKMDGDTLTLTGLVAKVGGSDLAGDVTVNLGEPMAVSGSFSSQLLDLADFIQEDQAATGDTATDGAESPYVFTEDPLPLDELKATNADIKLTAATLRLQDKLALENVDLTLSLAGGRLRVAPLVAVLSGGSLEVNLDLDGSKATPTLVAAVKGAGIDYGRLLKEMEVDDTVQGTLDLDIDLRGAGGSMRAIAAGLNGKTELIANEGVVSNRMLKVVGVGLSDIMGPLFGSENNAKLHCIVSRFNVENGLATSTAMIFDSEAFTVTGVGTVDLKTEKLDLSMDTSTRETSIASLAVPFNIKGTLKEPSFSPDPLGTALGAVKTLGLFIAPPVALGVLIADNVASGGDDNPCVAALAAAERGDVPAEEAPSSPVEAVIEAPVEIIEEVGKGLTEGLKSLFGGSD